MTHERRTKLRIYFDILASIESETRDKEKIKLTRVQLRSKLGYDILKKHLETLEELYLIKNAKDPKITEKGEKFLEICANIYKALYNTSLIFLNENEKPINSIDKLNIPSYLLKQSIAKYFPQIFSTSSSNEMFLKDLKQVSNAKDAIIEELEIQTLKI